MKLTVDIFNGLNCVKDDSIHDVDSFVENGK